uniref:CSON000023 protein n=1 Tax=Culicoides sonorensis TaxID=179676 RepID=A0A336MDE6_CULSO
MAVTKPMWNHTGEYSCWVQTFESNDRKTAKVIVIVPESDFHLQYRTDHEGIVHIRCNVYNISPEPRLSVILGNDRIVDGTLKSTQASNGLYITSRHIKIPQSDIFPESNINCILSIPKTNYTRRKEVVYFEQPIPSDPSEHEIEDFSSPVFSLGPFHHNGCDTATSSRRITWFIPFLILTVNILISIFNNNNYHKVVSKESSSSSLS